VPNYRKKGGLAVVSYPKQALKLVDGMIRVPLGQLLLRQLNKVHFTKPFNL
jgi:putative transposase